MLLSFDFHSLSTGSDRSSRDVRCEGYMIKKGSTFKTWRRRYFVLHNNVLNYYKPEGEDDDEAAGDVGAGAGGGGGGAKSGASRLGRRRSSGFLKAHSRLKLDAQQVGSTLAWCMQVVKGGRGGFLTHCCCTLLLLLLSLLLSLLHHRTRLSWCPMMQLDNAPAPWALLLIFPHQSPKAVSPSLAQR